MLLGEDDEGDAAAWGGILAAGGLDSVVIGVRDVDVYDLTGLVLLVVLPDVDSMEYADAQAALSLGVPVLGIGGGGQALYGTAGLSSLSVSAPGSSQVMEFVNTTHPALPPGLEEGTQIRVSDVPVTTWSPISTIPEVLAWDGQNGLHDYPLLAHDGDSWLWAMGDDGEGANSLNEEGRYVIATLAGYLGGGQMASATR